MKIEIMEYNPDWTKHGNIHNVRVPRFEIGKRGFKPTGKREGIGLRMKRGTRGMVFRPVRLCLEGSIDLRVEFAEPCRVCADDASIVFHLHGRTPTVCGPQPCAPGARLRVRSTVLLGPSIIGFFL